MYCMRTNWNSECGLGVFIKRVSELRATTGIAINASRRQAAPRPVRARVTCRNRTGRNRAGNARRLMRITMAPTARPLQWVAAGGLSVPGPGRARVEKSPHSQHECMLRAPCVRATESGDELVKNCVRSAAAGDEHPFTCTAAAAGG